MERRERVVKVILDSNFLFLPLKFRIDPLEELSRIAPRRVEPVILSVSLEELRSKAEKGSPKTKREVNFALGLAEKFKVVEVSRETDESVDEVILRVAREGGYAVATNDRKLKKRLRDINIPVFYLRGKSQLELDGVI